MLEISDISINLDDEIICKNQNIKIKGVCAVLGDHNRLRSCLIPIFSSSLSQYIPGLNYKISIVLNKKKMDYSEFKNLLNPFTLFDYDDTVKESLEFANFDMSEDIISDFGLVHIQDFKIRNLNVIDSKIWEMAIASASQSKVVYVHEFCNSASKTIEYINLLRKYLPSSVVLIELDTLDHVHLDRIIDSVVLIHEKKLDSFAFSDNIKFSVRNCVGSSNNTISYCERKDSKKFYHFLYENYTSRFDVSEIKDLPVMFNLKEHIDHRDQNFIYSRELISTDRKENKGVLYKFRKLSFITLKEIIDSLNLFNGCLVYILSALLYFSKMVKYGLIIGATGVARSKKLFNYRTYKVDVHKISVMVNKKLKKKNKRQRILFIYRIIGYINYIMILYRFHSFINCLFICISFTFIRTLFFLKYYLLDCFCMLSLKKILMEGIFRLKMSINGYQGEIRMIIDFISDATYLLSVSFNGTCYYLAKILIYTYKNHRFIYMHSLVVIFLTNLTFYLLKNFCLETSTIHEIFYEFFLSQIDSLYAWYIKAKTVRFRELIYHFRLNFRHDVTSVEFKITSSFVYFFTFYISSSLINDDRFMIKMYVSETVTPSTYYFFILYFTFLSTSIPICLYAFFMRSWYILLFVINALMISPVLNLCVNLKMKSFLISIIIAFNLLYPGCGENFRRGFFVSYSKSLNPFLICKDTFYNSIDFRTIMRLTLFQLFSYVIFCYAL